MKKSFSILMVFISILYPDKWSRRKWILKEEESKKIIKKALDLGINFFDTADVYSLGGSERILGKAIKEYADREEVVIATKVFFQ